MKRLYEIPIRYTKGIGPKKAELFNKIGIKNLEDLLYYFPRRYEDRTKFVKINELKIGQIQTIKAEVLAKGRRYSRRRKGFSIFELIAGDDTGRIFCVWFNQHYLENYFRVGTAVILYGKIEQYAGRLQITSPEFEIIFEDNDESLSIGRIVPVYSLPSGLTQRVFRRLVKETLDEYLAVINDFLPFDLRQRNSLLNLVKSFINIHFPENSDLQNQAFKRLCFEEFFLLQVPIAMRKLRRKEKSGIAHKINKETVDNFIGGLPFKLTKSQLICLSEIIKDMSMPLVMQRLLQGDVGSGKTVIAIIASLIAVRGGYQAAFMVPTEILAKQHYEKIRGQGIGNREKEKEIKIGLLVSSMKKKEKENAYQEIKEGEIDLIVGTHALLEETVEFKNLGLVVIDEQHKFGVGQRALLPQKGPNPDVLIMTATPIPRTLAITLYGDLDISVINELPVGRLPIKTMRFKSYESMMAYEIARAQLRMGRQAYIIYPVIEEYYALDIMGAKKMYAHLKTNELKEFKLGLLHGKMKQNEQDEIMMRFKNKELDALVSTTVLEVGIDIANATAIVIENAQRFGLSQLHQLRGRVGRGEYESFCMLISDNETDEANARIEAMVRYSDGFRIAEEDLRIRGPGEFFGSRQHGLSELKIANPLTQMHILKKARDEAIKLISIDYRLEMRQNVLLKEKLLQRFPEYEKLMINI